MGLQEFIMGIMVKKGIKSAVKLAVSFLTSVAVVNALQGFGVNIQIDAGQLEIALTLAVNTGLEMLRNWLKVKYGIKVF